MTPMMDYPLSITSVMYYAEKLWGDQEIVSVTGDNPRHRYTYRDAYKRVRQLANALQRLGMAAGEVVATLAWNDYRHFELYYAISCSGRVCHTINPRLFDEQIEYIVNDAGDGWIFLDPAFVPMMERLQDKMPKVKGFVLLTDEASMPTSSLPNVLCYEQLLAPENDNVDWPELPETTPSALCYTSGTTGNPKGVLYTHRSTILQCYAASMPNVMGVSAVDVVMPVVPMFHANGWALVYSAPMNGTKLVLPGAQAGNAEILCELINQEKVTFSAGVPTVWDLLLNHLKQTNSRIDPLQRMIIGGSALPSYIYNEFSSNYGVKVQQGWGMTELNPLATYNGIVSPTADNTTPAEQRALKQGLPLFGIEIKTVDENNQEQPWDGNSAGTVKVRGPWVIQQYFNKDQPATDSDGWFDTGDIGTIDANGYLHITDREKDIIKSGGEWIGSIELENIAMQHPDVAQAAVIGVQHPKWAERPLLLVKPNAGSALSRADILNWFEGKAAKWWIPDDCLFVDSLPLTATGKVSKKDLREQYRNHYSNPAG